MGYEIPAALGVRLADAEPGTRVVSFLGDGTFLMAPTELVTAAQEGLAVTLVVPENRNDPHSRLIAVPLSPAAGCTKIRRNGVCNKILPFMTEL